MSSEYENRAAEEETFSVENKNDHQRKTYRLGIDVGSTTVKLVILDPDTGERLYSVYRRHHANQVKTTHTLLKEAAEQFPDLRFRAAVCGSGGKPVAQRLNLPFIQEVVANAAAVCSLYPQARTAIELGGQDAKIIFFSYDEEKKTLSASDMRMNGSCAGGTGAFIDEIASLLDVEPDDFESLAAAGTHVFDISGRCGVFAKTDIQPLLIQGAAREDISLSVFHAIARQIIGGLAQGLEMKPPIIFEGGPLTFHPTLIRVFAERLGLSEDEVIIPDHPETIVALGTAMAVDKLFPVKEDEEYFTLNDLIYRLENNTVYDSEASNSAEPFFKSEEDYQEFESRHSAERRETEPPKVENGKIRAWLGIDSGSTTSKMVLMDEEGRVIDRYYSPNQGQALMVVRDGILSFFNKYEEQGIELEILGAGTTGYGESMMARAFGADFHIVETVAHSSACLKYFPDATFLLDIGGQDMKAIWLDDGIITNIMLNEACSSGCGSFLENFAASLNIPVEEIAKSAFSSAAPAPLGSRCTVFMNSTIITEQRAGKSPEDIMAGLCRSIIENVFTKVVRISNTDDLGAHIVVQGGTFNNEAVLRALEEYLGRNVTLSPYSGEMGALGAAILTKQYIEENGYANGHGSSFIGRQALQNFTYETETGVQCPFCSNHCSRTVISFSTGEHFITGNRCERGESLSPEEKKEPVKRGEDLFEERSSLLFRTYPSTPVRADQNTVIGIPRTLEFWDSAPFWSTFFRALGYTVKFSHPSSRKMYESGLEFVASDTICFPAKLVHGHILDLANQKVDRIFMPYVMHMPPEGTDKSSPYVCSVVQGYPMVVRNSQDPENRYHIPFDTPIFHWFTEKDRRKQICQYAVDSLGATSEEASQAFQQAAAAIESFRKTLKDKGQAIIDNAREKNSFVVVMAGRPYHSDPFVSHGINRLFTEKGISVIPVDSVPGLEKEDLSNTRIEITNNFHTRMLAGAKAAAEDDALEYVQLVSFGCGHDAVLSDEIVRIMTEIAQKPPLVLKIDESDAAGSLRIRVQSFIETVGIRRKGGSSILETQSSAAVTPAASAADKTVCQAASVYHTRPLPQPSPYKFYKSDKKRRTILIPNISAEVTTLLCAILDKENLIPKGVPVGGMEQIRLGKKYVHNDICFPCQMVIGELISALKEGNYNQDEVAVGMVKFQCDCRLSHYAGLLRKGLDAAGFERVPIVTTDFGDSKDMHPGVALLGLNSAIEAIWVFIMLDIITDLCRKIRPYECVPGQTQKVYEACVDKIADGIRVSISAARKAFSECIDDLAAVRYDRSHLKPKVFVTGELLVTYHPGSNFHIEEYLENNGMETAFPRFTDQLRKDFRASECEISEYNANIAPYPYLITWLFDHIQNRLEEVALRHPLYEKGVRPKDMYQGVKDIIPETLSCGEGWLMAAEIAHYAEEGVKSFIILQPFGCLPNHICGRGTIKRLKDCYPGIQILPLDLDPDTSYANVENRLQMLIMNRETPPSSTVA